MSLYATEAVPQPRALSCVVSDDVLSRTLSVRLPETANGYGRLLWREAYQALRAAAEDGWRTHPSVWASTPGAYQAAHVKPGELQTLTVHFPAGESSYSKLVSQPGLYAITTIDLSSRRFLTVAFLNRP
jgi:hypothetical protein